MATVDQGQQEGVEREGMKVETTTKGPRWSVRVQRRGDESDEEMFRRLVAMTDRMRQQYGEGV